MMFKNRANAVKSMILSGALAVPFLARATGPDFTGMTGQIDWTTAIAAVLLVMGGLAGVYVVMTGGSLILSKLRGGR